MHNILEGGRGEESQRRRENDCLTSDYFNSTSRSVVFLVVPGQMFTILCCLNFIDMFVSTNCPGLCLGQSVTLSVPKFPLIGQLNERETSLSVQCREAGIK